MATLLNQKSFAQVAPVNPPSGGFAIDGNLKANTSAGDWLPGLGSGGFVLNNTGIPIDPSKTYNLIDPYNSTSDLIFVSGSKVDGDPNSNWQWSKQTAPNKNDINHGLVHISKDASGNDWVILGGDRLSTSGTSYIDFELLQNSVVRTGSGTSGGFHSDGPDGGRTVNDLLISIPFTNGGGISNVLFYKWAASGSGFDWIQFYPTGSPFAATNSTAAGVPFGAFGTTAYAPQAFAEGAVNVSEVIKSITSDKCLGIGIKTLFIKTKAAASGSAELKDFIEPLQIAFNIGKPTTTGDALCGPGVVNLKASASGAGDLNWYSDAALTNLVNTGTTYSPNLTTTTTFFVTQTHDGCSSPATTVTGTISAGATVSPGTDQTICTGSTVLLNGSLGGSATSGIWTTNGSGTFSPNANALDAVYTPSDADNTSGSVILTLTTNSSASCPAVSNHITITINPLPVSNAGNTASVCSNSTITLNGNVSDGAAAAWNTTGNGIFDDATKPNAVYTPSKEDSTAGSVTLILTATNSSGCESSDQITLTINAMPTANAGLPQSICAGGTTIMNGSVTNATGGKWSSNGTGSFDDPAKLNAVYTPTAADVSSGSVTLTLTSTGQATTCAAATSTVTITINAAPTANAGTPQSICAGGTATLSGSVTNATGGTWSSNGTGSFDDETKLNAVHTPGTADITSGTLTLTSTGHAATCAAATSPVVITINAAPTANAGSPQGICAGGAATLSGSVTNATGGTWSSSGTGSFDDPTKLNPVYTPSAADVSAGAVTLTLTSTGQAVTCAAATSPVVITINAVPTADVGTPQSICAGGTATINGSVTNATGGTWSSSGTGSFDDPNKLNSIYTPSAADVSAGAVTLTLTSTGQAATCAVATSPVVITINAAPTANAGTQQSICAGRTATINGSVTNATGGTWSSSGTGSFDDPAKLNAVYTPSSADASAGAVTLTLTSTGQAATCAAATSNVIITIKPIPIVAVQNNCGSATLTASGVGPFTWSTTPTQTGSSITVTSGGTYTVTQANGCTSTASTVTIGNCSHIFPTQTTCCNYQYGNTNAFQFKQVCITPTYSTKGNTVGNAIPGVFFYYGDYTATATTTVTIVITQSRTNATYLAPFSAKSINYVHVTDDKCNTVILPKSATYDANNNVTISFKATAGKKYIISVKYDTKSIIGTKLPGGKPINPAVVAVYTFGMRLNSAAGIKIDGSEGSINATVGCSDNTPAPTGTCPAIIAAKTTNPIEASAQEGIPAKLNVSAAPNPFTNVVKFTIQSPVSGQASLDIFNLTGQKLYNVYNGYMSAGRKQTIEFNAPSKNSGSLIYSLKVGGQQVNGKLIQLK